MFKVFSFLNDCFTYADRLQIFNSSTSEKIAHFFNAQDKKRDYWSEEHIQRWELVKRQPASYEKVDPHDSWFPITFNNKGEIACGEISQQYTHTKNYPDLQQATKVAVEALAKKMRWENQTHLMGMSLVQHQMKPEQEYQIDFHQDASRYTLVILLNDEQGWSGGDLQFRSLTFPWIRQTVTHQQGYGILFTNQGQQHAVTPMQTSSEKMTERTILTIHEKCCLHPKTYLQTVIDRIKACLIRIKNDLIAFS